MRGATDPRCTNASARLSDINLERLDSPTLILLVSQTGQWQSHSKAGNCGTGRDLAQAHAGAIPHRGQQPKTDVCLRYRLCKAFPETTLWTFNTSGQPKATRPRLLLHAALPGFQQQRPAHVCVLGSFGLRS